ncbi:hypothetical protein AB1Y20_002115 [Prymnesium parvum]|uniref:Cellulase n=1 Tax=Prymnesium parvum TaxID=97485 RepID=A0AB34JA98_PRYPA
MAPSLALGLAVLAAAAAAADGADREAQRPTLPVNSTTGLSQALGAVCEASSDRTNWPFHTDQKQWYSCRSSAGATNDLGSTPQPCVGDSSSVRIELTPGKAECLVAHAPQCKIPMHDFVSLDYELAVRGCGAVWAAPLWITPDTWQWGAGSGEVDSTEMCPRGAVYLNFAGGGHQVASRLPAAGGEAHVTVRKDARGVVTVAACTADEAAAHGGQCAPPQYSGCDDCLRAAQPFGCWCNEQSTPPNIYGSGGCVEGTDCMWTLVSDIWNGVAGDEGYKGCMTEVAGEVEAGKPNLKSQCALSVQKIRLRGGGPNGRLQWGAGSPAECMALTV